MTPTVFQPRRIMLLSMDFIGKDGVSAVAREALTALRAHAAAAPCGLEAWALHRGPPAAESLRVLAAEGDQKRFARFGLKAALSSCRDTLIVAMHLHLAPVALPAVCRGARLAVFLHGIEAWRPLTWPRRRAISVADILIANSAHTAQRFRVANPALAEKPIAVCPLGAPPETALPPGEPGPGGFALIVGRMASEERYKGHDALLDVWPRLLGFHPSARLVVTGDGDDRERLERKAEALGLGGHIQFMGRVDDATLARLYQDCDFFAMPSSGEGFGLVFLEAMRAGKPCVAGEGAASEIIEHGVSGLIVNPADRSQILDALRGLFTDETLRHRLGEAGRRRVETHFSPESFRERFLGALGLAQGSSPCAG